MNVTAQLLPAAADADESVEAGRRALGHWGRYPWYDRQSDGVRRVEIPEPWDLSWLWDWLPDWGGGFGFGSSWLWTSLMWTAWIAIAVLLGVLVLLMLRAYQDRSQVLSEEAAEEEAPEDDTARVEALPFPLKAGRLDLLEEATRCYREGNYGRAVVYLFSFQLVQLDRQQIIRLTAGKTNRQYLREVGSRITLRRLVEETMVAFEDVFFGNRTLDRDRFESCWSRLDEFRTLAGAPTA